MNRIIGLYFVLFVTIAIRGQEIPDGVRYKTASAQANATAKRLLESALKGTGAEAAEALGDLTTCGPTLWSDLKSGAPEVLQNAKIVDIFLQTPHVVHAEGRGLLTEDQRRAFWTAVLAKYPALAKATVRRARKDEILYYWATIAFDIEEPLFTLEAGTDRFVANFTVKDGQPSLFWIDRIGDLSKIGTSVPGADASEAAARFTQPTMLLKDWKRYSFTYDGGATLSALLPGAPKEYAGPAAAACNPSITMTGHVNVANIVAGLSINVFYTSRISKKVAELSDKERNCVLAAVAMSWLSGVIKTMNDAGNRVEPRAGAIKTVVLGGAPGLEQDIVLGSMQCRIRMALIGENAYGAAVVWRAGATDEMPAAFLDSLRVE